MNSKFKILILLALGIFGFLVVRNVLVHRSVEAEVRRLTGFELTLDRIQVGFFKPTIEITGLKLYNPPDYREREAFDIRRAYMRYSPWMLLGGDLHLYEVVLEVPKLVVVRKDDGETSLSRLGRADTPAEEYAQRADASAKPERPLRIDRLTLKLKTIKVVGYPRGGTVPRVRTIDLHIAKTYQDVTSLNRVALQLAAEIMANEAVAVVQSVAEKLQKNGNLDKLGRGPSTGGSKLSKGVRKRKLGE